MTERKDAAIADIPDQVDSRLVTPQAQSSDSAVTDSIAVQGMTLRPETLDGFVGQESLRDNLRVFIDAACCRKAHLDHILLHGPPGLGKTTLAKIIATEMGVGYQSTSGPVIARAGDLAAILTSLQPRDVLFIDEIHRLNPVVEEILYPAMEDFQLDIMIGSGPGARSLKVDLPPFTLIGATTRSGLVTRPLRERFGIPLRVDFYRPEDLAEILLRAAPALQIVLDADGADHIACRARATPRIALRLLRRLCDFALVEGKKRIDQDLAQQSLTRLEVDSSGFDAMDRIYICCLADNYGGGPVGLDTLSAVIGEQRDVLEDVVEPYLMQCGIIQRTPRGRQLSAKGWEYLGKKPLQPNLSGDHSGPEHIGCGDG